MKHVSMRPAYDRMIYRRCGRSGLLFPGVSIGLWHNFGAKDDFETARSILLRAFDLGITHFDLANNYGPPPGSAETTFGKILKRDLKTHRDELIISSKAGYLMWPGPYGEWGSRKHLIASLDQSLQRMGLDYVDIFYSHRPDPETPLEETMSALNQIVKQGKALYAGISNYRPPETVEALQRLNEMGTPCLIHQASYSMLNRWVEELLLETLEKSGVGCIAFSPLAQGMLSDKYFQGIPEDSRAGKPHGFLRTEQVTEGVILRAKALHALAAERGQTLPQMAIAWLLRQKNVCSVLVGASRVHQIEENVDALNQLAFTPEELTRIEDLLSDHEDR